MADRKISDLTALTTPASGDFLPIVDISEAAAASKNKKITYSDFLNNIPTGTITSTMILDGTILNADINASAAIVDTKLATIATGGKVSNSATTATDANTASAIVARDASGNFSAGTITAALTGAASSNVLKAGDTMTGALVVPLASAATPSLTFTGDLNTGIYSPGADQLAVATNGTRRLLIDSAGALTLDTGDATIYGVRVGRGAGASVSNTAVGVNALNANTTGNSTVAIGYQALQANTTGSNNTAIGYQALFSNTTNINNVANGYQSLYANSTGTGNTACGTVSLVSNTTGSSNIAYGYAALASNTIGASNICVGTNSGSSLTTGSNNTIIGSITGTAGLANTVIIGAGSTERLRIDSSGNVGIGTSSPGESIHTTGKLRVGDGGNYTVAAVQLGASNANGISYPGTNILNFITNSTAALTIDASQRVGIGTTAPQNKLVVSNAGAEGVEVRPGDTSNAVDFLVYNRSTAAYSDLQSLAATHRWFIAGNEAARIDSSSRLLVGTSTSTTVSATGYVGKTQIANSENAGLALHGYSSGVPYGADIVFSRSRSATIGTNTIVQNGDQISRIWFAGANGTGYDLAASIGADIDGTPGASGDMPGRLVFSTTADGASTVTERMRIDSTGLMTLAGPGIKFPATQVASADANTLDDYEEGTWTGTLGGTTSESGQAYSVRVGKYVKVGKLVTISNYLEFATGGTGTVVGNAVLKGLPFVVDNSISAQIMWNRTNINFIEVYLYAVGGSSMGFYGATAAGTGILNAITAANLYGSQFQIVFSCSYLTT